MINKTVKKAFYPQKVMFIVYLSVSNMRAIIFVLVVLVACNWTLAVTTVNRITSMPGLVSVVVLGVLMRY